MTTQQSPACTVCGMEISKTHHFCPGPRQISANNWRQMVRDVVDEHPGAFLPNYNPNDMTTQPPNHIPDTATAPAQQALSEGRLRLIPDDDQTMLCACANEACGWRHSVGERVGHKCPKCGHPYTLGLYVSEKEVVNNERRLLHAAEQIARYEAALQEIAGLFTGGIDFVGSAAHKAKEIALKVLTPAPEKKEGWQCALPPPGWRCTRKVGHSGPCAAEPII